MTDLDDHLDERLRGAGERWRARVPSPAVGPVAGPVAPRRRPRAALVVAVAAAVAAAIAVPAWLTRDDDPGKVPAERPTPTSTATAGAGANRAAAVGELHRVRAAIPVPPGAKLATTAPAPWLTHVDLGPIDPTLTRARWYVVPMSYTELVDWYVAHSPARRGEAQYDDGTVASRSSFFWEYGKGTAAYTQPVMIVGYAALGPHSTGIRTTASLAARYDLPADTRVPTSVTSLTITRTDFSRIRNPISGTITDPKELAAIVRGYNDLLGAIDYRERIPCGSPTSNDHLYAVTFRWPGHALVVDPGQPLCGVGRGLTLDGTKLGESLEDSAGFDAVLESALRAQN